MSEKERGMNDIREAQVALMQGEVSVYRKEAERVADAILAEFDVTPRGEGEQPFERDDSDAHDHKWQWRQNVTSRGYRMTPYEVCVVDGCDAARQVRQGDAR